MHKKHPKSSDTMETRPVTPHFHFDFSPRIQLSCSIGSFMKIICRNQIVMFPFKASIECVERGQLLADLRDKYSSLLNRVPQQIKRYGLPFEFE